MSETYIGGQLLAGKRGTPAYYLAFNTPAELTPYLEGYLAVTLNPLAIYTFNEGQWVPLAAVEAGEIPPATVVNASETAAGIAELATQEETNAGSDTFRIVTPARLSGRTATEARTGLVELATRAETEAGTDDARAVHPAGLKAAMTPGAWITPSLVNGWQGAAAPFAGVAYRKDSSGRVHVRGSIENGSVGAAAFTLPAGYRPPADLVFATAQGGTDLTLARIRVTAGGPVEVGNGSSIRTHLNGVSFFTD